MEYQLCCYISVFWFVISYSVSRDAIADYISLNTHLNENQIDIRKKGFFNALWYHKIHKEFGIGRIYYFNAFFTIVLFLFLIGTSFLSFFKAIAYIVMPLGLTLALLSVILELFVLAMAIKRKKSYHNNGRKRLLGKIPHFYEIASIAIVLLFVWLQIRCFVAL